ncbi:MAG: 2-succinyl-5-enolpyruvyl-6-hydroxy-3-cyclohexene-1-carboxylic-acid synthase [bacterium]|nr:2-succinyl-5-enolpyruvyl-6-hydroxy-3-cyclohexene-1-carboxylic-acid synthase [bacterium]
MHHHAPNINRLWAGLIVDELVRNGVTLACVSPGSRSTPLTVAVAEDPRMDVVVHFDERGAAYHALGYARATGMPAALVCTSGTAATNYLPAVAEAANAGLPLILLTADRPPELRDTGANQTIDQTNLYGTCARWYHEFPCPATEVDASVVLTAVDQAVSRACQESAGPVHLNCPFREPLDPEPSGDDFTTYLEPVNAWVDGSDPFTPKASTTLMPGDDELDHVRGIVESAKQGLLVVGQLTSQAETDAAMSLADALGWPVFPDVASGLRLGVRQDRVWTYYDQLLLSESFRAVYRPDVVLQIGGPVTSKRLEQHLVTCSPPHRVRVAPHAYRQDPSGSITLRLRASALAFCLWLNEAVETPAAEDWLAHAVGVVDVDRLIEGFLGTHERLTEPGIARLVSAIMPTDHALMLGNSMPVRDMDMYASPKGPRVRVAANRGASGIDGLIATAAGFAHGQCAPVTAVIGDLSALHDLNSLALLAGSRAPVTLVVINNDGGGIFHFLPIAKHAEVFEPYFATPHGLDFKHAAAMFDLPYERPDSTDELAAVYLEAARSGRPSVIEVVTNRADNLHAHHQLQRAVADALDRA